MTSKAPPELLSNMHILFRARSNWLFAVAETQPSLCTVFYHVSPVLVFLCNVMCYRQSL